ncbi:MAG TPA: glycosyltransferase family 39 protein [Planctomycetaceae bacterium]|nr:glycosyltransferase family 39 protein [Planctomycetaceae bacterium]
MQGLNSANDGDAADLPDVAFVQPDLSAALPRAITVGRLAALFVALGVLVRLSRFLLSFPLSADEYQLAANFLDRGFLDLLAPLRHNQVAPIGFLWIEWASLRLWGFSEWSLRFFPLVCGVASVFAFRRMAGRLLSGVPLVFAVAIFAVAYYPIRYSAEVKPYAGDALVSLLLFSLALEWWIAPHRTKWLWCLSGVAPVALSLSFPAAFVAGGLSLAIAYTLWRRRGLPGTRAAALAFVAFNVVVATAFLALLSLSISAQYAATRSDMTDCWADGFPPAAPLQLLAWLASVHTSEMFAYPLGAEHGGSTLTSICFGMALLAQFRAARREMALAIVGCFASSLIAAALHRYPYGAHARLSQYLAPAICLLTGSGAALLLARLRCSWQKIAVRAAIAACIAIGLATVVRDWVKPYSSRVDRQHRDFARRFWNDAPGVMTVCLSTDLHLKIYEGSFETAYLCHQRICSPAHRRGAQAAAERIAAAKGPLRCVAFHSASARRNDQVLTAWMEQMLRDYDLVGAESHQVPLAKPESKLFEFYLMCYDVYHFRPKRNSQHAD